MLAEQAIGPGLHLGAKGHFMEFYGGGFCHDRLICGPGYHRSFNRFKSFIASSAESQGCSKIVPTSGFDLHLYAQWNREAKEVGRVTPVRAAGRARHLGYSRGAHRSDAPYLLSAF
jgi:hypothetical protein